MSPFAEYCTDYFRKYFELHPTDAIYNRIESYDHLLSDCSDEHYREEKAFVEESLNKLGKISTEGLNLDQTIDYALLEGQLTIQSYEHRKEDYRLKWPDIYLPIDAIYILTVRSTNDLAANLLSRLNRSPQLIQQGIDNLSRRDANPPKLWTQMAIEGAKGGASFLDNLPSHPKVQASVKETVRLKTAIETAKDAINDFASFLERDLLPRSNGVYAVGEEHYNLLLKNKHYLDHHAESLLALGENL